MKTVYAVYENNYLYGMYSTREEAEEEIENYIKEAYSDLFDDLELEYHIGKIIENNWEIEEMEI